MNNIAQQIIDLLFSCRRSLEQCNVKCEHCMKPHKVKCLDAIKRNEKISLILPAFPAKSANREKTISPFPDLGEVVSLQNLNSLCLKIKEIYEPGVELWICSDGRVFNDLVEVSEQEVNDYHQGIIKIIEKHKLSCLRFYCLEDYYGTMHPLAMRNQLMHEFGEQIAELQQRVKQQAEAKSQFNGIHRFLVEDQLALHANLSKNQVRKMAKEKAYHVVARSNAWSALLNEVFPFALRLSIHPQLCGSEKLGIHFIDTSNQWATPWHNVLLKTSDSWQLVKRQAAIAMGAVFKQDHYELVEG